MINYIEKGKWLHELIVSSGYSIEQRGDGNFYSDNDSVVQSIVDSFDPLPYAKNDAKKSVKESASNARARYVTGGAGKDAEYNFKAMEAKQHTIDGTIGTFMQGRMDLTGETDQAVADEWNAKSAAWQSLGATIAGIEDKAIMDINAASDWTLVTGIAQNYINTLDAI